MLCTSSYRKLRMYGIEHLVGDCCTRCRQSEATPHARASVQFAASSITFNTKAGFQKLGITGGRITDLTRT